MKSRLVAIFLFIGMFQVQAQRFGGNPTSVKWKQIDVKSANIIFPKGMDTAAITISKWINRIDKEKIGKLGQQSSKIPIVIQNLPVISNAYVGLGPWRSEFYTFPPQNALELGSTNWVENLVVHEYRHAHQFSNFKNGLSKFAYIVAGQQGQALANAASVPDWFFEGDAVYEETKYLGQGRGRLPYFFDPFHSIWLADKKYSYQKLRSGSLKDLVPNHYALGYMLIAHGNTKYGDEFWGKVTHDASRFKGLFYPFQKAVKRHTGVSYSTFVKEALASFKGQMSTLEQDASLTLVSRPTERLLVDHQFPLWLDGDSILALRKPNNEVQHWVMFHGGKEKRMGVKEIGFEDYFTYKRGYLVYTANGFDPRWSWKEYSDIAMLNIYDGSRTRLTKGGRYLSPDLSNNGEVVVAVHYGEDGRSALHFIGMEAKKREAEFIHPDGYYLSYPVFSQNDAMVYFIARNAKGESAVQSYDRKSGAVSTLVPFINTPISLLRARGNWLVFSVTQQNKNEFWKYDLTTGDASPMVSSTTGSYAGDIHPDGKRVVFTRPTAEGEQVYQSNLIGNTPAKQLQPAQLVYPVRFSFPNKEEVVGDSLLIKKYPKAKGLVNIHSWRPFYEQPEWSFTLYGENVLNTFQSSYDYVYNENEGSHKVGANIAYGGLYPWITAATSYTMNRTFTDVTRNIQWNEWNGNVGLRIPFNFSYGKLYKRLDVSATLNGQMLNYQTKSLPKPQDRFLSFIQQQVTWSMQTQKAVQQIFPRFAMVVRIQNKMAIGNTKANQVYATSQVYLPGIAKTHALVLGVAYQRRDTLRQYIFNNGFAMARGYSALDYPRMWKWNANYHFPILYPDFGIGNIVYFQRIRGNIFYDDMHLKSLRTGRVLNLRSAGSEIYFDTKWWNQQKVSFGFRYSRLLDANQFGPNTNANAWEFILPLNLLPN